ncbi:hypothetical protein [Desulfolutivibrio sulfoxidireducens]|uniref:hypothetical protein n=1 Tax=Desulfolutivibrio sulfoxidireducens TaxID=2773299 RepID=UPI00159E69C0|nr:hypothetical protein [Desulfolutivibrio sulfoxidireducens]QLA20716.1 hypothetical protein GD604_13840 [Desulfolutivibrio sulfoxidireducens]
MNPFPLDRFTAFFLERQFAIKERLSPAYRNYVFGPEAVSTIDMAASFEAVCFLFGLCAFRRPESILDLGTGISSAIFRLSRRMAEGPCEVTSLDASAACGSTAEFIPPGTPGCEVTSLDASAAWLEKSRAYSLKTAGDDQGFFTWEAYAGREPFDLVFVDIDYTPRRPAYYDPVLTRFTKKGSLVVFDDMHSRILSAAYRETVAGHPHVEYDIKSLTFDFFGRFSTLIQMG